MSKKPSVATQLRQAKADIRQITRELNDAQIGLAGYRGRATKAEAEAADWRRRFDLLLSKTTPVLAPPAPVVDERMQRCIDLLQRDIDGNYIPSIKLHRELFGTSLVEAKNAMEVHRDRLRDARSAGEHP